MQGVGDLLPQIPCGPNYKPIQVYIILKTMLFTIVSTLRISLYLWEVCGLGFSLCPYRFIFKNLPIERPFQNNSYWSHTCAHTHAHAHTKSQLQVCSLPCALSTNTTLESGWKLCPLRSICSPPEAAQLSMLCLSTRGSSCAER